MGDCVWARTTHLADAGVTDEKELEKIVVFTGMHGGEVCEARA